MSLRPRLVGARIPANGLLSISCSRAASLNIAPTSFSVLGCSVANPAASIAVTEARVRPANSRANGRTCESLLMFVDSARRGHFSSHSPLIHWPPL